MQINGCQLQPLHSHTEQLESHPPRHSDSGRPRRHSKDAEVFQLSLFTKWELQGQGACETVVWSITVSEWGLRGHTCPLVRRLTSWCALQGGPAEANIQDQPEISYLHLTQARDVYTRLANGSLCLAGETSPFLLTVLCQPFLTSLFWLCWPPDSRAVAAGHSDSPSEPST